jgi:molecular chaperone GrpE
VHGVDALTPADALTAMTARESDPTFVPAPTGAEADALSTPQPPEPPTDIGELLKRAETEAAELKDAYLRARAETENVRKQSQLDIARAQKYAIEKFAEDLLPVKDALEQTLSSGGKINLDTLKAGADLTLKALHTAFSRARLIEVDPVGEKFDPHRHQAMTLVASNAPANTVVDVLQKGYLLNDRVLRPALVTVSRGPVEASGE